MTAAIDTARWTTDEVARALGTALADDDPSAWRELGPVTIDARAVAPDGVFVALQGTRAHGAEFAEQARANGAAALVVGSDAPADLVEAARRHVPVVLQAGVDGVTALGRLATAWRRRCGYTVVGITGSAGKTSTKDLLAGLLATRRTTVASHANHNNEIGVPLTLLAADANTDVVVCEMGMRGLGQIRYLCDVAEPDVGIVTNAGTSHLGLLGTRERICQAKAELLAGVRAGGVAIAPAFQPELLEAAGEIADGVDVLSFGDADDADAACRIVAVERTAAGIAGVLAWSGSGTVEEHRFAVPVHGAHQAHNVAAAVCGFAAACGSLDGLDEAWASVRLTDGRGNRHSLPGGGVLIDDAYNASPESMRAALVELAATPGSRHVAVLGYMAELGNDEPALHAELGVFAARHAELDELVVVTSEPAAEEVAAAWEQATGRTARRYGSGASAAADAATWCLPGSVVLVKASNKVGLGALVAALRDREAGA